MEGPHPGGTAFMITVSPEPGKYELLSRQNDVYTVINRRVYVGAASVYLNYSTIFLLDCRQTVLNLSSLFRFNTISTDNNTAYHSKMDVKTFALKAQTTRATSNDSA